MSGEHITNANVIGVKKSVTIFMSGKKTVKRVSYVPKHDKMPIRGMAVSAPSVEVHGTN